MSSFIKELNRIYINNKRLDDIFAHKYEKNEPEMFSKNCIELLTELGEFANETKCFKYWSIKEAKKDECLEEYADCITMVLFFSNILDMNLEEIDKHDDINNILEMFNNLFKISTELMDNCNASNVSKLFNNLLYLGKLFNYNEDDIIKACDNKHRKIEERLNSNY